MANRKIFHFTIWVILSLFVVTSSLYAGDAARVGTAAGTQLLVPVGARDLAMGGSNIATTRGVDAIYWNPAGLSSMKNTATGVLSTMKVFSDIQVNFLGLGFRAGKVGVIGISVKSFDFGDIPETTVFDPDGSSGRQFSPTFVTTGLTYSRLLTDRIQVGLTGNLIYEGIPRASATAFAFDIGLQYRDLGSLPGFDFGVVVKNIGTELSYGGSAFTTEVPIAGQAETQFVNRLPSSDELPAKFELGVSYRRTVAEDNNLIFAGVFENYNVGNDQFKFGLEYMFRDLIALRGGYLLMNDVETEEQLNRFTLGVGLHYQFNQVDFGFDYTYRDSQYFDGENLFALTFGF
ncbi:MAG: PorV/PorQ family protein [bacterium]|nr:MAG: PorV/PorQ family protein [bacterium]